MMPSDSRMPSAPPASPISSHSTTCCQKICRPARAQRAPHRDLGDARQELAEQDADQVHRADREEQQRDDAHRAHRLRDELAPLDHLRDCGDAVLHRTREAAELLLLADVAVQPVAILRLRRLVRQLDPVLQPDRLGVEEVLPRVAAARSSSRTCCRSSRSSSGSMKLNGMYIGSGGPVGLRSSSHQRIGGPLRREHADDAEVALLDAHALADAVRAAEEFLVRVVIDHDHRFRLRVGLFRPRTAVAERRRRRCRRSRRRPGARRPGTAAPSSDRDARSSA